MDRHRQPGRLLQLLVDRAALNPKLASLTPIASGLLAVRLSTSSPDYLIWCRQEQLETVTWAGDPSKPMIDNDPLQLSPRRSFSAWSEQVRGSAVSWSASEIATARAFGGALADIIVQVNAVRLLIADQQLGQIREEIAHAKEAVLVVGAQGRVLFASELFHQIGRGQAHAPPATEQVADLFAQPAQLREVLGGLSWERQSWRGENELLQAGGKPLAVGLRVHAVPGRETAVLGFVLILEDLTDLKLAEAARRRLEESLTQTLQESQVIGAPAAGATGPDPLMSSLLANASLAALDVADAGSAPAALPLLDEIEVSTKRAAALYRRILSFMEKR